MNIYSKLILAEVSTIQHWIKHLNLDETSKLLDAKAASKMAGHTSTVITLKHYLVNEEERKWKS